MKLTTCSAAVAAALAFPSVLSAAPKVDGVIEADEWSDAAVYDGMKMKGKAEAFPARVTTYVTTDAANLYVAVRSEVPSVGLLRRVMPKRYGAFAYLDDTVTFAFADRRALVVNANGAYTAKGWEPSKDVKFASTVTNGFWSFESSIPLAEAGDLKGLDVGRRWPMAEKAYGAVTSVGLKDGVVPAADKPRVQVLDVSGGDKAYTVKVRVVNPGKAAATYDLRCEGKPENSQPAMLHRPLKLAAGEAKEFTMTGAILDDELVTLTVGPRTLGVRPNFAGSPFARTGSDADLVAYKFAYYPSYNQFRARVDVSLVPDYRRVVKGINCVLTDAAGKEVFAHMISTFDEKGIADETFPVPDLRPLTVKSGNPEYRIRLNVVGLKGVFHEKRVYRYAMDWEGNTYGLSDVVVPPFTAMSVEKGGFLKGGPKVRTVLREHELSSIGLFKQVKCPAKEGATEPTTPILAGDGVELVATVGGKEFAVGGKLGIEESKSPVLRKMRATFDEKGFKGHVDIAFEYDGQMEWKLTMEKGKLDFLKVVVPFRASEAKLMHGMPESLRGNYGGRVPSGTGSVWNGSLAPVRLGVRGDYLSYLWIGGTLRGLSVYGENDRGWVHFDGWPLKNPKENPVHCQDVVREKDGTVKLCINLVQKPFEITEPRTIRLFFMATPVKPMLENWRAITYGHFLGSGSQWGAAPQDADVEPFDGSDELWKKMSETRDTGVIDMEYLKAAFKRMPLPGKPGERAYEQVKAHNEGHLKSGFENMRSCRRKAPMVWYTNARGVDYGIPSGTTFCDEWHLSEFLDMDRDFTRMSKRDYQLDPNKAFQDYAGWWYRKMVLSGACDSLYWDDIYLKANWDLVGTDSYRLPDGRIQPATGVCNMRGLVKRCATVQAELGKNATNNWIHMTDTAIAPISAFAGVHFDMEDSPRNGAAFQKMYPMDYLEAVSIGRQMGARVKVIAHYEHRAPEKNAWYERTGAGMMLCYEFGWKWNAVVYNGIMDKLRKWGYRTDPGVRVWNYWNDDEDYPLALRSDSIAIDARGRTTKEGQDGAASIAMARGGEAIFVVNDFSGKGGTFRVKVNAKMLGLKGGFKAYDFESKDGAEVKVEGGEIVLDLKPYDFHIVILK